MLEIKDLKKRYGRFQALDGLSMEVGDGELYGFVGPNGAGKTTTIKIITGLLSADSGSVTIDGVDALRDRRILKQNIGYVPDFFGVYDNLKVGEYMEFFASCYGIEGLTARKRCASLLEQVKLEEKKDFYVDGLSRGMKQRLCLARALIHDPKLLVLDEPTSGLDPENAQNVNQMISQLAKNQGITVFLCTHQLRYAQEICTRYGLMEQGRLLASGSFKQLRESILPGVSLQIRASALPAEGTLSKILTKTGEDLYETAIRSEEEIPGLVRQMVNQGGQIYSVTARRPSLEDIYFALTASGREESL